MNPFNSLHFILNTHYLDDPQLFFFLFFFRFCFFEMVVLESFVCPEQLNCPMFIRKNHFGPPNSSVVRHLLYIRTLSDCVILRSIFSHEDN